jgi:hypothetical protein
MPQHMGKEAASFVRACELIHSLLALGCLPSEDRDIIEWSAIELLSKLRPA